MGHREADSRPDVDLVKGFILRFSKPVHWVAWWSALSESEDKEALGQVLFDEDGQGRDLTDPEMPERILHVVLTSPRLLEVVREETSRFLDRLAEKLADPERS